MGVAKKLLGVGVIWPKESFSQIIPKTLRPFPKVNVCTKESFGQTTVDLPWPKRRPMFQWPNLIDVLIGKPNSNKFDLFCWYWVDFNGFIYLLFQSLDNWKVPKLFSKFWKNVFPFFLILENTLETFQFSKLWKKQMNEANIEINPTTTANWWSKMTKQKT